MSYGDVPGYFESVSRFVAKGTPYGEDAFGYPVLGFLFVSIPWLLGARKFDPYFAFFRAQCFAVDVLLFWLLSRRCSRPSLLVYIVCTALLANLLYHRLDIVLGLLLVAVLALEARGSLKLASITLGASIALKVIPGLLVPAWFAWTMRRSLKQALVGLGFVALGAGGPLAIAYALWGKDALFFMGAHAERGVQVESIWASIQIVLMELGLQGKTYFGAGSYNLSTPLEGVFRTASHIAALAAVLWGIVITARLARRDGPFVLALASTLGALILASKVFSPQYFLFFLPLLAWSFESMGPMVRHLTMALTAACCGLTTWVYPYHEKELVALSGVATVPLVARNALFVLLVVLLQVHAWRSGRPERRKASPEEVEAGGSR
ncbi:MAG: DUF2029 domain-containing protein [Planctomycetes bacterium]|nr:DUF2029 domain-containing protein [Planctomycetota bacterium]